jgi:hypothetical protein
MITGHAAILRPASCKEKVSYSRIGGAAILAKGAKLQTSARISNFAGNVSLVNTQSSNHTSVGLASYHALNLFFISRPDSLGYGLHGVESSEFANGAHLLN